MKITVERSGGIAALTRTWTVQATTSSDKSHWQPIVEACPWDAVPDSRQVSDGQPDRFMYSIRAGQRRATLPEQGSDRALAGSRGNDQGRCGTDAPQRHGNRHPLLGSAFLWAAPCYGRRRARTACEACASPVPAA